MTLLDRIERQFLNWEDHYFDLKRGIETRGEKELFELDVDSPNIKHARKYQASHEKTLRWVFHELEKFLEADFDQYNFVDVGCGKGRVLIKACEFPFRRILGIEFAKNLAQVCAQNICERNLTHRILLRHEDALTAPLLPGASIYYLYNPFDSHILKKFLERLKFYSSSEMPNYLVCVNPIRSHVIDMSGQFKEISELKTRNRNFTVKLYRD